MNRRFILLSIVRLSCAMLIAVALSGCAFVFGQSINPGSPSREYIRLGGRVIATESGAPGVPTSLRAISGNTRVHLIWVLVEGALDYNLYRSEISGGPYAPVDPDPVSTDTSHTDTGLNNGTPYYYIVSAVTAEGESGRSNEVLGLPLGSAPVVSDFFKISITRDPASIVSGADAIFKVVYKRFGGYTNITFAAVLISGGTPPAACYVAYFPEQKEFALQDGGQWSLTSPVGGAPLQNAQCVLNVGGSSVKGSGTDLEVIFSVHFLPAFADPIAKNLDLIAKDLDNVLQDTSNTWVVEESHTPVPLSVTPAIGSGSGPQLFTYYFYHPDGAANINNTITSIAGNPTYSYQGCYLYYDYATSGLIGLAGDDGVGNWVNWLPLTGSMENSQCKLNPPGSAASSKAEDRVILTLNLSIEFLPVYAGFQFQYMGLDGGIPATEKPRGLWVIPGYVAPEVISLSSSVVPPSGISDFQFLVSDDTGGDNIRLVQFSMIQEGQTLGCKPVIYPKLSRIFLLDNSETGWVNNAGVLFGDDSTPTSNSRCTISGVGVSVTPPPPPPPDISCTVDPGSSILTCSNVPFTASIDPPFEGPMTTHVTAVDIGNLAATRQMGTWSVPDSLPAGWTSMPINAGCTLNAASYSNGVFTVIGANNGNPLGMTNSFEFAYTEVPETGNITMVSRIPVRIDKEQTNTAAFSAGIMLRSNLDSTGPYALLGVAHPTGVAGIEDFEVVFRTRIEATPSTPPNNDYGESFQNDGNRNFYGPFWFKLERTGDPTSGYTIIGYTSANGVDWKQLGGPLVGVTTPMTHLGFAVAQDGAFPCAEEQTRVGTFDNVTVSTTPDFYLTEWPVSSNSTTAGETSSYTIGVNPLNDFTGPVNLSVTGLPPSISWVFNPATVNLTGSGSSPAFSNLTLAVSPGTPNGDYPFTIHASDTVAHSLLATLTVNDEAIGQLPGGWASASINNNCTPNLGSATFSNGVFSLTHRGGGLPFGASEFDSFFFTYVPITGDVTIEAALFSNPTSASPSSTVGAATGLMLRTGATSSDDYALMGIGYRGTEGSFPTYELQFRSRTAGTTETPEDGELVTIPGTSSLNGQYWLRLQRSGTDPDGSGGVIRGYWSTNRIDWQQLGTEVSVSSRTMYAGIALAGAGCQQEQETTVEFNEVTIAGGTGAEGGDFSLAVPPGLPSVNAGGSLNVTTTVTATGGFNGEVGFGVSGLPNGATGIFSPPTVTGSGASALILDTSQSQTLPGIYPITILGASGGLEHTVAAAFGVNGVTIPPPTVSLSTPSGSGNTQTFVLNANDPNGNENLTWMQLLINNSLSGIGACYLHYDKGSNMLYLRDDSNPSWVASAEVGQQGIPPETALLSNSQCLVNAELSSFSATGGSNDATLSLDITFFASSFAGPKTVYALVDSGNLNSGWEKAGYWTVPTPVGALPTGWAATAVANPCEGSTAAYDGGVFTVTAAGGLLRASPHAGTDSFEFAYVPVTGDVTIVGRIPANPPTNPGGAPLEPNGGVVGIMLRNGLSAISEYALAGVARPGGVLRGVFRRRTAFGSGVLADSTSEGGTFAAPRWFKLERRGAIIRAYTMPDGGTWEEMSYGLDANGDPNPPMTLAGTVTTLYAGLAVAQGNGISPPSACANITTIDFDNVEITQP